jgi:hypothetical protein
MPFSWWPWRAQGSGALHSPRCALLRCNARNALRNQLQHSSAAGPRNQRIAQSAIQRIFAGLEGIRDVEWSAPIKSGRGHAAVLISWRPFRLARSPRTNLSHFAMPARFSGM